MIITARGRYLLTAITILQIVKAFTFRHRYCSKLTVRLDFHIMTSSGARINVEAWGPGGVWGGIEYHPCAGAMSSCCAFRLKILCMGLRKTWKIAHFKSCVIRRVRGWQCQVWRERTCKWKIVVVFHRYVTDNDLEKLMKNSMSWARSHLSKNTNSTRSQLTQVRRGSKSLPMPFKSV